VVHRGECDLTGDAVSFDHLVSPSVNACLESGHCCREGYCMGRPVSSFRRQCCREGHRQRNGYKRGWDFSIQVSDPEATLVFSFIGMITQEHQLKNRREILVVAKWECAKDFF